MEGEVWRYFLSQGPFAILFVWTYYTSRKETNEREKESREREKESRERENKLQELLFQFSDKYDLILEEVRGLKNEMSRRGE